MRRIVLLVVVASVALGACSTERDRAAGVTERFLQALSDSGRHGLIESATERAAEHGDTALAIDLAAPIELRAEDERLFRDLEVGAPRPAERGGDVRVPLRLTQRLSSDAPEGTPDEVRASAVLEPAAGGASWYVVAIEPRAEGERVPSEGGARPATAEVGHWMWGAAIAALMTLGSVILIEASPLRMTGLHHLPPDPTAEDPTGHPTTRDALD